MFESLLIVGIAIILVPPVLERLHVDIRAGEVITGILFVMLFPGIAHEHWLEQVAEFALLVLMFEIGLDIDTQRLQDTLRESLQYAALSFFVPFAAVFIGVFAVLQSWVVALIIAIGLSSTALAVVGPLMNREGIESPVAKNAAMFSEMIGISLLVVFVRAQQVAPGQLLQQAFAIFGFILFTIFGIPRITAKLHLLDSKQIIRFETKLVLFIVIALSLISERLGTHAATGAFLAGLFFSESTHRGMELEERITPISELVVPIFFFHIGTLINTAVLQPVHVAAAVGLGLLVYGSRMASFKFTAWAADIQYRFRDVALFAPCVTITSAAASIAKTLGVLSDSLFATFILAGLILTVIGPFLLHMAENGFDL